MHTAFCSDPDKAVNYGPCLKWEVNNKMKALPSHLTKEERKAEYEKMIGEVKAKVPIEQGQVQMDEMHDMWCDRSEAASAEPGSALHDLCDNYRVHKENRKTEL